MKFNNRENKSYNTEDGVIYHSRSVAMCCTIITYYRGEHYVLIGKRSKLMDNAGKLNMVCGYLDWDESIEDGFKREVYEESGLDIDEILYLDNKPLYYSDKPWDVTSNLTTSKQNVTLHMGLHFEWCNDKLPIVKADAESDWVHWVKVKDFNNFPTEHVAFNHQDVLKRFFSKVYYLYGYKS